MLPVVGGPSFPSAVESGGAFDQSGTAACRQSLRQSHSVYLFARKALSWEHAAMACRWSRVLCPSLLKSKPASNLVSLTLALLIPLAMPACAAIAVGSTRSCAAA